MRVFMYVYVYIVCVCMCMYVYISDPDFLSSIQLRGQYHLFLLYNQVKYNFS